MRSASGRATTAPSTLASVRQVNRREFLIGLTAVAAGASVRSLAAAAEAPMFMYIGSFTKKDGGHGEGLSVYRRDSEATPWKLVDVMKELADPSFIVIDRQKRFIYSSHGDGTHATS